MAKRNTAQPLVCSFFRAPITNAVPAREMSFLDICKFVSSDYNADVAARLWASSDKAEIRNLKRTHLHYCTPAGVFLRRGTSFLRKLSGMMVLDLDDVQAPDELARKFCEVPTWIDPGTNSSMHTLCAFVSPSGRGVKILLDIRRFYEAHNLPVGQMLDQGQVINATRVYGILFDQIRASSGEKFPIDKTGRDIARACYLSKAHSLSVTHHGFQQWTMLAV